MDLEKYAAMLQIPRFRGVFMRNGLPKSSHVNETAIVNLDDKDGPGTHWVAYAKRGREAVYFDPIGNLRPPEELVQYLRGSKIKYNDTPYQTYGTINCGHLCLEFLYNLKLNVKTSV